MSKMARTLQKDINSRCATTVCKQAAFICQPGKDQLIPMENIQTRYEVHFGDRVIRCYASRPASLYAMLAEAAGRHANQEALVCGSTRYTWRTLADRVQRIAAGLAGLGVVQGSRVALLIGNRAEFVEACFAVAALGALIVPVSTREQAPGIAHIVNDSQACVLIYEEVLAERLPDSVLVPALQHRIRIAASSAPGTFAALANTLQHAPVAQVHEDDTAAILYTSGTTGKPKGAMLAHLNIIHSAMHYEYGMGLSNKDRMLAAVPLSHVTGLVALMATAVRCAATLIIMPAFKAPAFLALAAQERMTHTLMVPAMYNLCLIQGDCGQYDLSEWRVGAFGGAIMPQATIEKIARLWPGLGLVNVYGATETTSPATIMPAGASGTHLDSVGKKVQCGEMVIMDDAGHQVPAGSAGELWISGPMVVSGYWNNAAATRDHFTAGFWRSGDIGKIDEHGFISVLDRKKDMINRGGFKIYSSEVENILCQHPDVFEAAVIGKPCPVLGERVHAVVVVRRTGVCAGVLTAYCAERLADYQVPESFTLSEAPLPRNPNGKILKKELRSEPLA